MIQQLYNRRRLRRIGKLRDGNRAETVVKSVLHSLLYHNLPIFRCCNFVVVEEVGEEKRSASFMGRIGQLRRSYFSISPGLEKNHLLRFCPACLPVNHETLHRINFFYFLFTFFNSHSSTAFHVGGKSVIMMLNYRSRI